MNKVTFGLVFGVLGVIMWSALFRTTCAPVVVFRTESGLQATYNSAVYSQPRKYKKVDRRLPMRKIKGRFTSNAPVMIVGRKCDDLAKRARSGIGQQTGECPCLSADANRSFRSPSDSLGRTRSAAHCLNR